MSDHSDNIVIKKSFAFAVRIIRLHKLLRTKGTDTVLCRQLLRCGTSIGANIREAHNAESKNDFIHKMGIAQKEMSESLYWLELLKETEHLTSKEYDSIYSDASEMMKIIRSIIITSKKSQR